MKTIILSFFIIFTGCTKIIQIGWQDWRVVTPPSGNKLLVVMTRGMDKNAKWQGKHNGKLYIEK